ncbi:MAG TPA: hypothetical protein PLC34_03690 [Burkholderiaceae bacterium]|nr:hypothetical protein [Burkholderiaceae bacterium]
MNSSRLTTAVSVREVSLFERHVNLRLPFRFGAATVTQCPQAFVRVRVDVAGKSFEGASAELMVPKWFDKSSGLTHAQNFEQLREALRCARESYVTADAPVSPYVLSLTQGEAAISTSVARSLPRLAAQFGSALLDKAIADAVLRATGQNWVDGVSRGVLGDPWSGKITLHTASTVWVRHTVGLADRIVASDPGTDPADGLPATLEQAIAHYGLRYFKIKLSGQADADRDRLTRIASVLAASAADYRVTLDGNETFSSAQSLGEFWQQVKTQTPLRDLLARTLLLEQPLPRTIALNQSIARLGIDVPVILDESDDHADVFERGVALGYRGISSKACKGIYRSLHSAWLVAQDPQNRLLSGEDLTCQAGLAVQQDTLLASSLGVKHIERNGHHYVDGFGTAPESESLGFAQAHPGLYAVSQGRARLAVQGGQLNLSSLHGPGFGRAASPLWSRLNPIN